MAEAMGFAHEVLSGLQLLVNINVLEIQSSLRLSPSCNSTLSSVPPAWSVFGETDLPWLKPFALHILSFQDY